MKRGTPRHPKLAHLRQLLKIGTAPAVGYLELLWHFTAEFAPQGDVGRYSDERIEAALHWQGKSGRLISAMAQSGWLDLHPECRLCVHDWADHADDAVKKRLSRSQLPFVRLSRRMSGQRPVGVSEMLDMVRLRRDDGGLPEPEPGPQPNPRSAAKIAAACDLAAETFDLSDEERAEAWPKANGAGKKSLLTDVETLLDQVARQIHARHPAFRRCGIAVVKKQLTAIMRRESQAERVELLHRIDENRVAWCQWPEWCKETTVSTRRGLRTGLRRPRSAGTSRRHMPQVAA